MFCFFHKWNGCKCSKCGKIIDKNHKFIYIKEKCINKCEVCEKIDNYRPHAWVGYKCEVCGETSEYCHHVWNGCVCKLCNETRHDMMEEAGGFKTTCRKCGYIDEDEVRRACEWGYI